MTVTSSASGTAFAACNYESNVRSPKSASTKARFEDGFNAAGTSSSGNTLTGSGPDFTRMSSNQLRDWINDQIKSGKMTVAESSPYIGLTLNGMPLRDMGNSDTTWQNQPRNYLDDVRVGISGAKWRGDHLEQQLLEGMLARLTREQGMVVRG